MAESKLNASQKEILNATSSEKYPLFLSQCDSDVEFQELIQNCLHQINTQNKSF